MNRLYSLKKNEDIKAVLNHQTKRFSNGIGVFMKPNKTIPHYRIAFSVPKKYGNAVKRNRMKRQLREIVREVSIKNHVDIFILIKADIKPLTYQALEKNVHACFKQLKLIGDNHDKS